MKRFAVALVSVILLACLNSAFAADLHAKLAIHGGTGVPGDEYYWMTNSTNSITLKDSATRSHAQGAVQASYGYLSMTFSADGYETANGGYAGDHTEEASWDDMVTISSPTLNGTVGYLRPDVIFSGTLAANVGPPASSGDRTGFEYALNAALGPAGGGNIGDTLYLQTTNSPFLRYLAVDADQLAASNSLPLDVAFYFGQPFQLKASLFAQGGFGFAFGGSLMNHHGHLTFWWRGGTVLDVNSNIVNNFTQASESGKNWFGTQFPGYGPLTITSFNVIGHTNCIIGGGGGEPYYEAFLLSSTNLTVPLTNWDVVNSGVLDMSGQINFTNAISSNTPARFFRLKTGNAAIVLP